MAQAGQKAPQSTAAPLQIFTSTIEIVVSSRESQYTCCTFVETAPPGGGPPPHCHDREDEMFVAMEGEFEFYLDGTWSPMKTGETRFSPRGHFHGFRNVGAGPARMLLMTTGGGIDEYFAKIAGLKLPDDFAKLVEISEYYGYHFLPPAEGSEK